MSKHEETGFSRQEGQAIFALSLVFFLRMFGIFLVLPVLSPYAVALNGGEKNIYIGLAMGAFPLGQFVFQLPFGWLSDRFDRKKLIVFGLVLFAAGSLWAGLARSVTGLILALLLQGSGAIGSVILALIGDVTREHVRTRSMAIIGAGIGLAFGVGFLLGPVLRSAVNVPFLFYLIAGSTVPAIALILFVVPVPEEQTRHDEVELSFSRVTRVFLYRKLWPLNTGIFVLNGTLRGLFVVVPFILLRFVAEGNEWEIYLPVMLVTGLIAFPAIFLAERKGFLKTCFYGALASVLVGLLFFELLSIERFTDYIALVLVALVSYLVGFSILESILPSLVSRAVEKAERGTAMGLYSMSQYFGSFCGGLFGSLFLKRSSWVLFLILSIGFVAWGVFFTLNTRVQFPSTS